MGGSGRVGRSSALSQGQVLLLLFSTARTAVGAGSMTWPVPPEGTSVRDLLADLVRVHPRLKPILPQSRCFHDGNAVTRLDERVRPGEELAIHPPYGGG